MVDESSGQALALIEESARRMERSISILSELLQVSVRRSVPQDEVSLTTLLPNLLEELQPAFPDVTFELEMPKTEVVVSGEYQSARIALRNLLENAAKYSNREPRVRVVMGDGASGRWSGWPIPAAD